MSQDSVPEGGSSNWVAQASSVVLMGKGGVSQPYGEKDQMSGYHIGDRKENGRRRKSLNRAGL